MLQGHKDLVSQRPKQLLLPILIPMAGKDGVAASLLSALIQAGIASFPEYRNPGTQNGLSWKGP